MFGPGILRFARRFIRHDNGGVTIEAVLWMPVFVALLCLVADASLIFGRQAEVLRVVQDANRAMSVGKFGTDGDIDATDVARDYFTGYAPSSPSIGFLKNGELVKMFERRDLEGRPPMMIAQELINTFQEVCTKSDAANN